MYLLKACETVGKHGLEEKLGIEGCNEEQADEVGDKRRVEGVHHVV